MEVFKNFIHYYTIFICFTANYKQKKAYRNPLPLLKILDN
jgi:hypothetical protein